MISLSQCVEKSSSEKNLRINLKETLSAYNAQSVTNKGVLETGEVIVSKEKDKILVTVVQDKMVSSHPAFFLQINSNLESVAQTIKDGSVLFLSNQFLVLNNKTGETILFRLGDIPKYSKLADLEIAQDLTGIGVGKTTASFNTIENAKTTQPISEGGCDCKPDGVRHGCSSGGLGSTSCSCCGCSVSCGAGHYSCCN